MMRQRCWPSPSAATGLHWSASALFTLYCALQNDLGQGVLTGDVAIPSQFPLLDRGN